MKQYLMKKFALTETGGQGLTHAVWASFVVYCINMLPVILSMIFLDDVFLSKGNASAGYIAGALATLVLLYISLNVEYECLYNNTYKESANLRIRLAKTLSELPLSYFSKHNLSDLSQTFMADIEGIEHAMTHSIPKVGAFVFFFPLMGVLLLCGNWKMGLAVILPTLVSFLMVPLSKKLVVRGNKKYFNTLRENSELFQESIELQQEIKSYDLGEETRQHLFEKMDQSEAVHWKSEMSNFWTLGLSNIFSYLHLAVVILVGLSLLQSGEINVLYLLGYLLAAIKIKDTVDATKEGILEVFYLDPKVNRIREIRENPVQYGEDKDLTHFDIDLHNVRFGYQADTPVLRGVTFTARQGEVTALIGASGCGKTSILRLISRLYDYDGGRIRIDGKDIKQISTNSLFRKTSIVFQEVTLFNTSILENIRLGRKDANDEEVLEAATLANCMDFVERLPEGIHTVVGENGAELSGGERQRISIARAFLKDAPILILDEIAANLDVDNEKKIQQSLNRLIRNKTVVVISHRLKSVENADKIVVIDDGGVESEGRHEELLLRSPMYRNLIEKSTMAEEFVY